MRNSVLFTKCFQLVNLTFFTLKIKLFLFQSDISFQKSYWVQYEIFTVDLRRRLKF